MQAEETLFEGLAKALSECNQEELQEDLHKILNTMTEESHAQITELVAHGFCEEFRDIKQDNQFYQAYGITKENFSAYCNYEFLGWRYFTLKQLADNNTPIQLDKRGKNSFFNASVLKINIAWYRLLSKLLNDYRTEYLKEKGTDFEKLNMYMEFFAKAAFSPDSTQEQVELAWFPNEVKKALDEYCIYILETAKFLLKYKLPMNRDSCKQLTDFIEEMSKETLTKLQTSKTSKIISNVIDQLVKRFFPDISKESKQRHPRVPSLMFQIFSKNVLPEDKNIPQIKLKNNLHSLNVMLKKPITEWIADINKLNEELLQALYSCKALCKFNEFAGFENYIERPIKAITEKLEILSSLDYLSTEIKTYNSKHEIEKSPSP